MRRIYAACLQFDADPADALPKARAYTRHWVSLPWGGWPAGQSPTDGSFTAADDTTVRWRTLEADASRLWELQLDEPFAEDSTMRQQTLVQVGKDAGQGFAYIQVSLRSTDGALTGGVVYENAAPDIVETLVERLACTDGRRQLRTVAWPITRAQEKVFAELLVAPRRRLPVLLFVSDAVFPEEQATAVAASVAALAHVAVVPRDNFPDMVERLGLDVPDGAAAYLWWAATASAPSLRRPQWFRGDALAPSQWGVPAWPVVRTIYSVAAFRLSPPAMASQLEADSTLRRIRALEERAPSPTVDAELLKAWEADLVSLEETQRRGAELEVENERLQGDVNALLATFDAAVADAARTPERSDAGQLPAPASLVEAVRMASGICRHLVFLPEAFRSAEAWQFPRPDVALEALHTLDRLTGSWRADELEGPLMVAARAAGLPWRPAISRTAQTRYRDDYARRFGDQEILLGPHLAWGTTPENSLRIYLYLDRETRTIVVGHAGRHLRDTSNPHG